MQNTASSIHEFRGLFVLSIGILGGTKFALQALLLGSSYTSCLSHANATRQKDPSW